MSLTRLALVGTASIALVGAASGVASAKQVTDAADSVRICHATSSDSNPYVENSPSTSGDVSGHAGHTGPVWNAGLKATHTAWGDIIPPFDTVVGGVTVPFAGLNWDAAGQAFWNNGCAQPAAVTPVTPVTPAVDPVVVPVVVPVVPVVDPVVVTPVVDPVVVPPVVAPVVVPPGVDPPAKVDAPAVVDAPAAVDSGNAASVGVTPPVTVVVEAPVVEAPAVETPAEETVEIPVVADPVDVAPAEDFTGGSGTVTVSSPTVVTSGGGGAAQLPMTGAPVGALSTGAAGLLGAGVLLLLAGRRRTAKVS